MNNGYVPEEYYRIEGGITLTEFIDIFKRSIPIREDIIQYEMEHLNQFVFISNLSGEELTIKYNNNLRMDMPGAKGIVRSKNGRTDFFKVDKRSIQRKFEYYVTTKTDNDLYVYDDVKPGNTIVYTKTYGPNPCVMSSHFKNSDIKLVNQNLMENYF